MPARRSRSVIVVVGVLVVVLAVAGGLAVRAVLADDGPRCVADALDGPLPAGDVRLAPFADDSPWKQPVIDASTVSEDDASEPSEAIRRQGTVRSWVNAQQYSIPVVQATECDPVVTFQDPGTATELGPTPVRIPTDAAPAEGTDAHLMVIQPDGTTVIEMWTAERLGSDRWNAGRVERVDLTGSGIGPDNGVRAYGGSALGGLIRRWEVDPTHPNYTDGVIRHPLAIALPGSMLRYDSGDPGYDAAGYGTARGYVAPATEQDYDSPWTYAGPIPMGAKVVLPASVDVDALGFPPALAAVARTLQSYGGYVTDRTGDETVALYAEPTTPSWWLDEVRGPSLTGGDLDRLRALLVVVPPASVLPHPRGEP